jgi:hypothetical protein
VDHLEHLISKVNWVNFEINSVLPSLLLVFVEKVLTCLFTPPSRQLSPWPEGNQSLPNGVQTAPSYHGAIKGTVRRMKQYTKPPLNILRCLDSANTHSVHCV